jgi:LysM repeat protein
MSAKRLLQITLIMVLLAASLAIPRSASAAGPCGSVYIVQPGDWLIKIANYCGVSLSALYAANPGVAYQFYIYPGQALNIPGGGSGGAVPGNPPPVPGVPQNGCATPFCQPFGIPASPGAISYHWYPSMVVTPQVGGNFFQAAVSAGTQFTFQTKVLNNGDVPLQVIANLTPPSDWEDGNYNDCPGVLNVGAVCTFTWVFTPHNRGSILVRVYVRGFYTDPYGASQRVTNSPAFVFNVQ